MKQVRPFTIAIFVLLWLVACVQEETAVPISIVTETAVATSPTPITQAETLIPTPELFFTVPITSIQTKNYRLRSPDPAILIDVLAMAIQQLNARYSPEFDSYSSRTDVNALLKMLERELNELDPKDLTNTSRLVTDSSLETTYFYCCDLYGLPAFQKPLQAAATQYFNQYPSLITPGNGSNSDLNYFVTEINLDDDEDAEWFVEAEFLLYGIRVFLPLELNEEGEFLLLPNDLQPQPSRFLIDRKVILEQDITGDGRSEIIIVTQVDGSTAWGYPGAIDIYSWNGAGLYRTQSIDIGGRSFAELARYDLADYTDDNLIDIRVYRPHSLGFGCSWEETITYSWQENKVQSVVAGADVPDTAVCQVEEALFTTDPELKVERLEAILAQLLSDNAPSTGYLAILKVHLAMAYAEMFQDSKAEEILNSVCELSGDSGFVQLVNEHYGSSNGSLITFFQNLFQDGNRALETDIGEYLVAERSLHFAPLTTSYWLLCPFDSLLKGWLEMTYFPGFISPIDTLASKNISVEYPFEMMNGSEKVWLGFIHTSLIAWNLKDDNWQPSIMFVFESPVNDAQFDTRDVTGDGQTDLVVSAALKNPQYCYYVENKEEEYKLILFNFAPEGERLISERTVCEKPPSLSQIGLDYFDEKNYEEYEISWYFDIQAKGQTWVFSRYIDELQDQILSQANQPSARIDIMELISQILEDDQGGELASNRLLYLIGLSYELSGDEENAVSTYLDLIQQFPTSPWSWLAWARLEPVAP